MRITSEMYFKLYVNIEWNNVKCFIFLLPLILLSSTSSPSSLTDSQFYNLVFIYGQRQQNMLRVRTTIARTYMCHLTLMNSTQVISQRNDIFYKCKTSSISCRSKNFSYVGMHLYDVTDVDLPRCYI